jgi:hypothetical protein
MKVLKINNLNENLKKLKIIKKNEKNFSLINNLKFYLIIIKYSIMPNYNIRKFY